MDAAYCSTGGGSTRGGTRGGNRGGTCGGTRGGTRCRCSTRGGTGGSTSSFAGGLECGEGSCLRPRIFLQRSDETNYLGETDPVR
jgi:hypothetical protein